MNFIDARKPERKTGSLTPHGRIVGVTGKPRIVAAEARWDNRGERRTGPEILSPVL